MSDIDSGSDENVATVKLELELEKLGRAWSEEERIHRRDAASAGIEGHPMLVPLSAGFAGIVFVGIGISVRQGMVVLMGLVLAGLGLIRYTIACNKMDAYNKAKEKYEHRRQQLLQQIAADTEKGDPSSDTGGAK